MAAYDKFIASILPYAKNVEAQYGIPTSVTLGQAIHESAGGTRTPKDASTGKESFNIYGVKGTGDAGSVSSWTTEYVGGVKKKVLANFRAYSNWQGSLNDYGKLLTNDRYKKAFTTKDSYSFLSEIRKAGYATDPNYTTYVSKIMTDYNLTQYDGKSGGGATNQPTSNGWMPNLIDKLFPVTSRYGLRRDPYTKENVMHEGVDFSMKAGTSVASNTRGKVTHAGTSSTGWGTYVEVEDEKGRKHIFAHLTAALVKVGDMVMVGGTIGKSGSTGKSSGAHLHYEVREGGKAINPDTFLQTQGEKAPWWNPTFETEVFGNGVFGVGGESTKPKPENTIATIPIPFGDPIYITKDALFTVVLFIIAAVILLFTLYSMFLANTPAGNLVATSAATVKGAN